MQSSSIRRAALVLALGAPALTACDKGAAKDDATKSDSAKDAEGEAAKADAPKADAETKPAPEAKPAGDAAATTAMIDHKVQNIDGQEVSLADYRGKAMLIVNTASECGFTPQYTQLQKLHEAYGDKGLVVLGFPSNDFGGQEPGSHEEIKKFVKDEYGVEFPMFAKVKTKGDGQAELYKTLTTQTAEPFQGDVKWNFTKFLVSPDGEVVARFESPVDPMSPELTEAVEAVLPKAG